MPSSAAQTSRGPCATLLDDAAYQEPRYAFEAGRAWPRAAPSREWAAVIPASAGETGAASSTRKRSWIAGGSRRHARPARAGAGMGTARPQGAAGRFRSSRCGARALPSPRDVPWWFVPPQMGEGAGHMSVPADFPPF